jgi:hypothetical protein
MDEVRFLLSENRLFIWLILTKTTSVRQIFSVDIQYQIVPRDGRTDRQTHTQPAHYELCAKNA